MCLQKFGKPLDLKGYAEELLKFHGKLELYEKLKDWQFPKFPINGATLKDHNCPPGRVMGHVIQKLKMIWVENEFKSTTEELLVHLPKIYEELSIVDGKQVKKPKHKA